MQEACYPDKAPRVDQLLETLSHYLRREVILFFEMGASASSFNELVEYLDLRVPHLTRDTLETMLWHHHLPVLAANGWLEHDGKNDVIHYRGHESARKYLNEIASIFERD